MNKMPHGNEKIIYVRFIPRFMKNGRSFKSRDEISIRRRGCNTLVLNMHLALAFHEHKHHPSIHEHEHIEFHLILYILSHVMLIIYMDMLVIMCDQFKRWLL